MRHRIDIWVLCILVLVHLLFFGLAPFTFSWTAFVVMLVLYRINGVGITIGYHRLLTHDSFMTYPWVRYAFMLNGMSAAQGTPLQWVADHRRHHQFSDQRGKDPHTPLDGFLWSHWMWTWLHPFGNEQTTYRYSRKLAREKFVRICSMPMVYLGWNVLVITLIALSGYLIGGWRMALSMFVYAGLGRLVIVYNATWFVNSATHTWGYQNYKTGDESRNLWWVALLTSGEGWHNNHHSQPTAANHGQRWWELDESYGIIRTLRLLRLAWNVNVVSYQKPS